MNKFIDLVNFNADASCLSDNAWEKSLSGGKESTFYRWLNLYAVSNAKISLGFTGATLADISYFNPDSIDLIRSRSDIFEIVSRPFSHDAGLLRTKDGFIKNYELGKQTIRSLLGRESDIYLPPEFILTSEQVSLLAELQNTKVLVNSFRLSSDIASRIPNSAYKIIGNMGSVQIGLPIEGELTNSYLTAIQKYNSFEFFEGLSRSHSRVNGVPILWRDGESPFFLPETVLRENYWVQETTNNSYRLHFSDLEIVPQELDGPNQIFGYPPHSFAPWTRELKFLGVLNKLNEAEKAAANTSDSIILGAWLQSINSDVLSAVEKQSVQVLLAKSAKDNSYFEWNIIRTERGREGEDWLAILEELLTGGSMKEICDKYLVIPKHVEKLIRRQSFLSELDA